MLLQISLYGIFRDVAALNWDTRLRFMLSAWLHVRVINFRIIIIIIIRCCILLRKSCFLASNICWNSRISQQYCTLTFTPGLTKNNSNFCHGNGHSDRLGLRLIVCVTDVFGDMCLSSYRPMYSVLSAVYEKPRRCVVLYVWKSRNVVHWLFRPVGQCQSEVILRLHRPLQVSRHALHCCSYLYVYRYYR